MRRHVAAGCCRVCCTHSICNADQVHTAFGDAKSAWRWLPGGGVAALARVAQHIAQQVRQLRLAVNAPDARNRVWRLRQQSHRALVADACVQASASLQAAAWCTFTDMSGRCLLHDFLASAGSKSFCRTYSRLSRCTWSLLLLALRRGDQQLQQPGLRGGRPPAEQPVAEARPCGVHPRGCAVLRATAADARCRG